MDNKEVNKLQQEYTEHAPRGNEGAGEHPDPNLTRRKEVVRKVATRIYKLWEAGKPVDLQVEELMREGEDKQDRTAIADLLRGFHSGEGNILRLRGGRVYIREPWRETNKRQYNRADPKETSLTRKTQKTAATAQPTCSKKEDDTTERDRWGEPFALSWETARKQHKQRVNEIRRRVGERVQEQWQQREYSDRPLADYCGEAITKEDRGEVALELLHIDHVKNV